MEFTNKQLNSLIIPLVLQQVLEISVGMSDVMMVSLAGEAAVSGVSLVDMINNMLICVFAALATGGAVVTSQYIGKKNIQKACKSINQLYLTTTAVSFIIMLFVLIFKVKIMHLLYGRIDTKVMHHSIVYLTVSAISYPVLSLYNSGAAVFRSMGNSRTPLLISVIMNLMNITGNIILIIGFRMGVFGAAISSLIARTTACVIITYLLTNHNLLLHLSGKFSPDLHLIKKILKIGIPAGFENGLFQFGRVVVVSLISSFGTIQIAANAVANNLDNFGCIPGQAMSYAMITIIGQCVGAGDYKKARYYTKKLLRITYAMMFVLNGMLLLALPLILRIYNLAPETLQLAQVLILIHNGCAIFMWPAAFVLPNALRASNDVKFTMIISIFSMCTFRVLFSYILGMRLGYGAIGVWIAMVMDWIFRLTMFIWRFVGNRWEMHDI